MGVEVGSNDGAPVGPSDGMGVKVGVTLGTAVGVKVDVGAGLVIEQWSSFPSGLLPCASHSAPWLGCGSGRHVSMFAPWQKPPSLPNGGSALTPVAPARATAKMAAAVTMTARIRLIVMVITSL